MNAQPPITPRYTETDVEALHTLMSQLLSECASLAAQHAPTGAWTPAASGPGLFEEAPEVIATISRSLNQARRHIRALSERARQHALPVTQAPHAVQMAGRDQSLVTSCRPFRTPGYAMYERLPDAASPTSLTDRPQTEAV